MSVTTGGSDTDMDGYEFTLNGGTARPLESNGAYLVQDLTPGDYQVALSGVAANCTVSEPNPLTVTVTRDLTVNAKFTVTCTPMLLAPPGRDIALVWKDEIYLLSADGSTFANLTKNPETDVHPTWSPDGRKIAFSSGHVEPGVPYPVQTSNIFVMNADGSGRIKLTSGAFEDQPAWSPDGSKIAFRGSSPSQLTSPLFLMNADGSGVTPLTVGPVHIEPAWSPDGSKIAFVEQSGSYYDDYAWDYGIYLVNADGSGLPQMISDSARAPAWSPDGTKMAFVRERSGIPQVYVMNSDGTGVTQLTFGYASDAPAWSPDGSKIAFIVRPAWRLDTADQLYMMNPDGSDQVPLTRRVGSLWQPAWRP